MQNKSTTRFSCHKHIGKSRVKTNCVLAHKQSQILISPTCSTILFPFLSVVIKQRKVVNLERKQSRVITESQVNYKQPLCHHTFDPHKWLNTANNGLNLSEKKTAVCAEEAEGPASINFNYSVWKNKNTRSSLLTYSVFPVCVCASVCLFCSDNFGLTQSP